ncbi:MAG: hypothetical protein WBQ14_00500 [Gaiellaceae bacterium]
MTSPIPLMPKGDPAGMLAEAARLRLQADKVNDLVDHVYRTAMDITYVCPIAEDFRNKVTAWKKWRSNDVKRLLEVSYRLKRSAAKVQDLQHARAMALLQQAQGDRR